MKLLIATHNPHKLAEIRAILELPGVEIVGADAVPGLPDVVEDGDTFEANATKKAVTLAQQSGLWALADDSGLVVDALNGAPGVWSARYAGEAADSTANNRKLLAELEGRENRSARFQCVMCLASSAGLSQCVEGRCEGRILEAERGANGFGYDPLFVPEGHDETFAEMAAEAKNLISHRAMALKAAAAAWFTHEPFGFQL